MNSARLAPGFLFWKGRPADQNASIFDGHMQKQAKHIGYFFFSQYLADGARITLAILVPALLFSNLGAMDLGLLLSTGALCVSMGDAPGPLEHKKNGMLYCILLIFIMSLLTGFANHSEISLGLLVILASFFFTMLTVFGIRASSVGSAALLIMVIRMDKIMPPQRVLLESLFILGGGLWYMFLAFLMFQVRPFRQAQRTLGNCIHETSKLLLIKAALYDPATDVNEEYKKLLDQQVIINERHDEVRQLLYKSKSIVKDTTRTGQVLLITFTDAVDLYEQISATWYDYPMLRVRFSSTGILPQVAALIKDMAAELDRIGLAIQSNIPYKKRFELEPALNALRERIDNADIDSPGKLVLTKILINFRNLGERVNAIAGYFHDVDLAQRSRNRVDYTKFVSHQEISFALFRDNLNLNSAVFRHSLRMVITCILGFIIAKMISYGHHSYWILLTIIFILKPGYGITKERNLQRIAGTIAGGILGILIISNVTDRSVLVWFIVFFMLGTYTWQRLNYIVMVIFMTPYILIVFNFLGLGFLDIVEERVLDTAIASVLAFFASYFLFPHWESGQLDAFMADVLKANINYLDKLIQLFLGKPLSVTDYKLSRKHLYVNTANLSAAFNRMLSEPKGKQQNAPQINEFVVLNNVLSSNVASLFPIHRSTSGQVPDEQLVQPLQRAMGELESSLAALEKINSPGNIGPSIAFGTGNRHPDPQLQDQVDFIYKIAVDIRKVVRKITAKTV